MRCKVSCVLTLTHSCTCIATLGKLEALRVSNDGVIENLRSQITLLQQKLQQTESERESLQRSQRSSSEEQSVRIRTLERVT